VEAVQRFAHQAPNLVVALFKPVESSKIPLWEQQLSCGAALMNLLTATHALGYAAGWVTGWAAFSETVRRAFAADNEVIAVSFSSDAGSRAGGAAAASARRGRPHLGALAGAAGKPP
jgi:nitroreductase